MCDICVCRSLIPSNESRCVVLCDWSLPAVTLVTYYSFGIHTCDGVNDYYHCYNSDMKRVPQSVHRMTHSRYACVCFTLSLSPSPASPPSHSYIHTQTYIHTHIHTHMTSINSSILLPFTSPPPPPLHTYTHR